MIMTPKEEKEKEYHKRYEKSAAEHLELKPDDSYDRLKVFQNIVTLLANEHKLLESLNIRMGQLFADKEVDLKLEDMQEMYKVLWDLFPEMMKMFKTIMPYVADQDSRMLALAPEQDITEGVAKPAPPLIG